MRRVLFVVDERKMGGVSILLEDILKKINLDKFKVDIMILHNNGDYLDNLDSRINILYGTKFFKTVDYSLKEVIKSKNILDIYNKLRLIFLMKTGLIKYRIKAERKKCIKDVYDVEVAFKDGFCAVFTAYGNSKKKYHWLHTDYSMYDCTAKYRNLFNKVFMEFDGIIGISNSVLAKFKEKYSVKNTEVIFNLIDEEKIKKMASETRVKFDSKKINFISVGRIHNMKGYDRLVKVFARLKNENLTKNICLRIIGDGPDFDLVKNIVDENNLNDVVLLIGRKKNPFPYVKDSDCFFMCSRYEPFGLVVLESMILNTPVISTEVASIREIMDSKYGIIVENSEDGLYQITKKIINNKKMLEKYKKNLVNYKYPIDDIVKKIEKVLDR